jgi:hypothetical protein
MAIDKKLEERRKKVLRFDRWTCKLCEEFVEAPSKVGTDDEKSRLLIDHVKTRHKDSRDVDYGMKDEFLVLYFTPYTGDVIQDNEKLL